MKNIYIVLLFISTLFITNCKDDDNEKSYDVEKWLDKGQNQKVINALGNCSQFKAEEKDKCYLNLGAAYFGLAKFDLISLAKEFADIDDNWDSDKKSKEFNKIIFTKLDNDNLQIGIDYYKKLISSSSVCNEKDYDESLTKLQKQACLSINPMLISALTDDDDDSAKSTNSASLEDIIKFKDIIKDAVPEISSEDLVSIIDGGDLEESKDANNNDKLDSLEATDFAINVFANSKTWTGDGKVTSDFNRTANYTHPSLSSKTLKLAKITIDGSSASRENNSYFRVIDNTTYTPDYNTTLTTVPDVVCDADNIVKSGGLDQITSSSGNSFLPCIEINDDGNVTNLNDSVVNVLNDDDLIKTIALSKDSEDDSKTDDEKIADYRNDICDINGTASSSNTGKCSWEDGKLVINQDAFLDYMNEDK